MRKILLITMACAGVAATATTVQAAATGSKVQVSSSRYGRVLFDGRGHALYSFTREHGRASRCYGACAKNWPPFLTKGAPRAIRGARADLLGTTRRRDGSTQVTYN